MPVLNNEIVLSFSGGLDSTVLLGSFLSEGHTVTCVSYQYGSHHNQIELKAAKTIVEYYQTLYPGKVHSLSLDLSSFFQNIPCDFTNRDKAIPKGKYAEENMARTVVPARNLVFISAMASYACAKGISTVAVGIHSNDSFVYPDCRPSFFHAIDRAVHEATGGVVCVIAPLLNYTKTQIVREGIKHEVPFHLTRTCYTENVLACGQCGSCVDRLLAFKEAGMEDPIRYVHHA